MSDFYIGQRVYDLHGDLAVVRGFDGGLVEVHMLVCRCQYKHVNGEGDLPDVYRADPGKLTTAEVLIEEVNIP